MDLKIFYQKLRQTEAGIQEPQVLVVSNETAEGGKAGVLTEAPRAVAARLIVEGRARLATEAETAEYHAEVAERRRAAEQAAATGRMQITVVSDAELRALKSVLRPAKG